MFADLKRLWLFYLKLATACSLVEVYINGISLCSCRVLFAVCK